MVLPIHHQTIHYSHRAAAAVVAAAAAGIYPLYDRAYGPRGSSIPTYPLVRRLVPTGRPPSRTSYVFQLLISCQP